MTSERDQARQSRAVIDRFVTNLRSDSAYAKRYRDDPVGVVLEAGFPPNEVADVLREDHFSDEDVAGFAANFPSVGPSLHVGTTIGHAGGLGWCICTDGCCCTSCCLSI